MRRADDLLNRSLPDLPGSAKVPRAGSKDPPLLSTRPFRSLGKNLRAIFRPGMHHRQYHEVAVYAGSFCPLLLVIIIPWG